MVADLPAGNRTQPGVVTFSPGSGVPQRGGECLAVAAQHIRDEADAVAAALLPADRLVPRTRPVPGLPRA